MAIAFADSDWLTPRAFIQQLLGKSERWVCLLLLPAEALAASVVQPS